MRNKISFFVLVPVLALCAMAISLRAQEAAPVAVAVVKTIASKAVKPPKANFEVLNMLPNGIQVRSITNGYEIHTFSYSDAIRTHMLNMLQKNAGYQYGDKVEIVYEPNSQVALKIKGKPSKPL
jgi:hypothetical protein